MKGHGMEHRRLSVVCLAALLSFLILPATGFAAHGTTSGPDSFCYACHTLDMEDGENGTSLINSTSRTLPLMKFYNGNTVPELFGCVYCHQNPTNTKMKSALSHFQGKASMHPVGYNFVSSTDTNNEFITSWGPWDPDGVGGLPAVNYTAFTNELDCTDCHDVNGLGTGAQYPEHGPSSSPATNPYMLRNVTALNDYDPLCRTCHGRAAAGADNYKGTGVNIRLGVAQNRHEDASASFPIQEADGTPLKTTQAGGNNQCRKCHDVHFSMDKLSLFNDGKDGDAPITADNCTEICHYPGDEVNYTGEGVGQNTYTRHGHGKTVSTYKYRLGVPDATGTNLAMGMACSIGGCHVSMDLAAKPHIEVPTVGTNQEKYRRRFNLGPNLQAGDTGNLFGNPIWSVCLQCHSGYMEHQGSGGSVGCLDCHDEHAEGSGTASNVFMIPETSKGNGSYITATRTRNGTESVIYDTTQWNTASNPYVANAGLDYFRTGGAGMCDQGECHPSYAPLSTWLGAAGGHAGPNPLAVGYDCTECHGHNNAQGWRAGSCDSCHQSETTPGGYWPETGSSGPDRGGRHQFHMELIAARLGYTLPASQLEICEYCHAAVTNDDDHMGTYPADVFVAEIATVPTRFAKRLWDAGTDTNASYTPGDGTDGVCSNVDCHDNNPTTAGTYGWYNAGTTACVMCHDDITSGVVPTGVTHQAHLTTNTGGGGTVCTDCHTGPLAWGAPGTKPPAAAHLNGTFAVSGAFTYTGTYPTFGTCGTNTCHNNGQLAAPRTAYTWGTAIGGTNSCTECHGDTSATQTLQAHNEHTGYLAAIGESGFGLCDDCHTAATVATHGNGSVTLTGGLTYTASALVVATSGGTFANCSAGACHDIGTDINWNVISTNCNQCHYDTTATARQYDGRNKTASELNTTEWTSQGHGKGGVSKACTDCHSMSVAHDYSSNLLGSTNPFRLGLTYSTPDTFCNNNGAGCHTVTGLVENHLGTNMGGSYPQRTWLWSPKCYDCHNPHGDGSNLEMIRSDLNDDAGVIANSGSSTHGVPNVTEADLVDFTTKNGIANGSYADTAAGADGICQECHTATLSFLDDDVTPLAGTHPTSGLTNCTSCHSHANAFEPASCDGCHGDGAGNNWPDGVAWEDRDYAHSAHVGTLTAAAGGVANDTCTWCHPGNPPVGHSSDTVGGANQASVTRMSNNATWVSPATAGDYWGFLEGPTNTSGTAVYFKNMSGANDTNAYYDYTAKSCYNIDCHGTGTPNWTAAPPVPNCTLCHPTYTTHVKVLKTQGSASICTACHPGGGSGPHPNAHAFTDGSNGVLIPNPGIAALGIAYTTNGGIHLGGTAITYGLTTEAEICWRCHDQNGGTADGDLNDAGDISEWGTNTSTNGLSYNYNFGTLTGRGWNGSNWTSAVGIFSYKTAAIQSVHTANSAGSAAVSAADGDGYGRTETPDANSLIRCSYCHDVHDSLGGSPNGAPFLRGTWMSSPYEEDGAPHSSQTFTSRNNYGAIPRGGTQYTQQGGYFIDQNNVPTGRAYLNTSTWSYANNGGLCALCHTMSVATMDQTTGENLWIAGNGHKNAVIGGTAGGTNIFDYTHGRPTHIESDAQSTQVPNQGYAYEASRGYGYRGTAMGTTQTGSYTPTTNPGSRGYSFASYNWGASVDNTTNQNQYHRFPCSKCHNPHASRLPKLLITNCLDINHNTWDDNKSLQVQYSNSSNNTDWNKRTAYYDSAQNCHRANDSVKSSNPGWNKVSPWGGSW